MNASFVAASEHEFSQSQAPKQVYGPIRLQLARSRIGPIHSKAARPIHQPSLRHFRHGWWPCRCTSCSQSTGTLRRSKIKRKYGLQSKRCAGRAPASPPPPKRRRHSAARVSQEVEREKREREAAAELKREQEHFQNAQLAAQMGDTEAQRLVAAGDVMFMYAAPGGPKGATQAGATAPPRNTEEESEGVVLRAIAAVALTHPLSRCVDEAVRRFKAEVLGIAPPEVAQEASGAAPDASSQAAGSGTGATAARRRQRSGGKGGSDDDSGEDDAAGGCALHADALCRPRPCSPPVDAGRPAFLKHAPVEGEFARGTKTLKPFNQVHLDAVWRCDCWALADACAGCSRHPMHPMRSVGPPQRGPRMPHARHEPQWCVRYCGRRARTRLPFAIDLARQQREDPATVMAAIKQLRQGEMAGGIRLKPSAMVRVGQFWPWRSAAHVHTAAHGH